MKRSSLFLLHAGLLLSFLMIESILFFIGCAIRGGENIYIQVWPWIGMTLLFLLCNDWLSNRELPVNLLIGINIIFSIVSMISGFFFLKTEPATLLVRAFQMLFPLITTLAGFYYTWYPDKIHALVLSFDMMVTFFFIYLFLDMIGILPPNNGLETAYLTITAVILLLIIYLRMASNEERSNLSWKGILPVLLIIAGTLLLALTFALVISGQVKSITDLFVKIVGTIVMAVFTVIARIADLLGTFFFWLLSLLPDVEEEAVMMEEAIAITPVDGMEEAAAMSIPLELVVAVIAVFLIAGLCFVFWRMKGVRITRAAVRKSPGKVKRNIHLPFSFSGLLKELYARIHYRIQLFRKRKTPAALALLIEQHERHHGRPRKTNESAPAYLQRLSMHPDHQENKALCEALLELSHLIQQEYYAGTAASTSRGLYHMLRTAFSKP